jgi:hypothetical protein
MVEMIAQDLGHRCGKGIFERDAFQKKDGASRGLHDPVAPFAWGGNMK